MYEDREDGFSLVELLVVIVIIGILSAIAIGVFMNQRKKAVDSSVESDVRNASIVLAGMGDSLEGTYVVVDEAATDNIPNTVGRWEKEFENQPINVSEGTIIEIIHNASYPELWNGHLSNAHEYCIKAGNGNGDKYNGVQWGGGGDTTDNFAWYDPSFGGLVTAEHVYEHSMSGGEPTACYVAGYTHAQENGLTLPPSPTGEGA